MKIDILSDLHFDNYFYCKYTKDDVIKFYSQIIDFNNCGDVLVIAGDLGHNNHQNIKILKILKEFYKNIVCVLGNHDYINILEIENFDDFYEMEKPKIEKVYKDCDVMITHINPSVKDENMNSKYKNNLSNTFFCFDGEEYLKNGSMKYWIFGHNHDVIEYKEHNVTCICNPVGYHNESGNGKWIKIKQIEV